MMKINVVALALLGSLGQSQLKKLPVAVTDKVKERRVHEFQPGDDLSVEVN